MNTDTVGVSHGRKIAEPTEIPGVPGYSVEELAHLAADEQIVHLDDLLLRRTSLAFVGGLTRESLEGAAAAIAPALGWDEERRSHEVDRAVDLLRSAHRVELGKEGVAPLG